MIEKRLNVIQKQLSKLVCTVSQQGNGDTELATEATAQAILAALGTVNDNLTNNTNALLTEIRDSNVSQEALATATNNLLTEVRDNLVTLNNTNQLSNQELQDLNTELDNIEATLNSIEAQDSTFYTDLLAVQNTISTTLNGIDTILTSNNTLLGDSLNSLNTLVDQTDQLETLLTTINTSLDNNTNVNAAALEQLRLLLVSIDANTDAVESELVNIIAEHDQTQVILTNILNAINTDSTNQNNTLNDILEALTKETVVATYSPSDFVGQGTIEVNIVSDTKNITTNDSFTDLNDLISKLSALNSSFSYSDFNGDLRVETSGTSLSIFIDGSELLASSLNAGTLETLECILDELVNLSSSSERTLDVVEALANGQTDAGVQSVSLLFRGSGGTIDGVAVPSNTGFSFNPNKGQDTVGNISYTVPTTGEQRVIISYVR